MNLLDRSAGVFVLLFLILVSCEEPNEIGLVLNPGEEVGVYYAELPIEASMVFIDSIATSNVSTLLSGTQTYTDLGTIEAIAYTQVGYNAGALNAAAVLDSLVLQLSPSYFYGADTVQAQRFYVHRIVEGESLYRDSTYFSSKFTSYNEAILGTSDFVYGTKDDTTTVYQEDLLNIKLDADFAQELFTKIKAKAFDSTEVFYKYLSGFAVVADQQNNAVMGFDLSAGKSRLVMHYHTATDTSTFVFNISNTVPHYTHIKADYSGVISDVEYYQELTANNGLIYGQAGLGLLPKLKFSAFKNFTDTAGAYVLNSAAIDWGTIGSMHEQLPPPSKLYMYLTDEKNFYLGNLNNGYQSTTPLDFNYVAYGKEYLTPSSSNLSDYFTMLKEGRLKWDEVLVYSSTNSSSVNIFSFDPSQAKLKLYYTKLKN